MKQYGRLQIDLVIYINVIIMKGYPCSRWTRQVNEKTGSSYRMTTKIIDPYFTLYIKTHFNVLKTLDNKWKVA